MKKIVSILMMLLIFTSCNNTEIINNSPAITIGTLESEIQETQSTICKDNDNKLNTAIEEKKNELNKTDSPFGVCDIYSGTRFDYNKDGTDDYVIAYGLYAQFEFVIFDEKTCEILVDERVMMYLEPENLFTEIYTDDTGNFTELFSSKIQVVSAGELTETVQIIKNNDTKIFEAVYDHDTGEFLHAYDEYSTYDEYISAKEDYLKGYKHFMNISWCEYKLDCN